MEITKKNENYSLKDTLENNWYTSGDIAYGMDGSISFWASVSKEDGSPVGNIHFTKPAEGNANVNYDMSEENREFLAEYSDKLIDFVVEKFK